MKTSSIVHINEHLPVNEFERQLIDFFGEQVAGVVSGINYDGYSSEKVVLLFHHTPLRLFQSLKNLLGDRRFYLRAGGCYRQKRWKWVYGEDKEPEIVRGDMYRLRIFLE